MTSANREDYLKRLYLLQQEHAQAVPMGALAAAMAVAPASVTGMVKSLVEENLVEYEPYRGVQLTTRGERQALDIIRRHRLIEAFLVETLGLDWTEVHEEAERLEHAISQKLLDRIDEFLGRPATDPHGDPIPAAGGRMRRTKRQSLAEVHTDRDVSIRRVIDQDTQFLQFVDRIGLRPGTQVRVIEVDPNAQTVTVADGQGKQVTLSISAASKLLVDAK